MRFSSVALTTTSSKIFDCPRNMAVYPVALRVVGPEVWTMFKCGCCLEAGQTTGGSKRNAVQGPLGESRRLACAGVLEDRKRNRSVCSVFVGRGLEGKAHVNALSYAERLEAWSYPPDRRAPPPKQFSGGLMTNTVAVTYSATRSRAAVFMRQTTTAFNSTATMMTFQTTAFTENYRMYSAFSCMPRMPQGDKTVAPSQNV